MFIDNAGLLRAIHTLDGEENSPVKVQAALAFLLEFVWFLDMRSNPADHDSQMFIVICEGRILGCLKRFISKRKHEEKWQSNSSSCSSACHRKLVRLSIVVILFGICCHSSMAPSVIRERLHLFFTEVCLPQGPKVVDKHLAHATGVNSFYQTSEEVIDPQDILFTVDPFDWCYQSVCVRLVEDHRTSLLVPIGARSLAHLLRGEPIPTDEIAERDILLNRHSAASCSYNKPYSGRKVKSDLPSIFAFSRSMNGDNALENDKSCNCAHPSPAMLVASNESTLYHWALRSLIALSLHFHRPSSLRKDLIAGGDLVFALVVCLYLDSWNTGDTERLSELPIQQNIAFRRSALCNMAVAGFSIIQDEEISLLRTRYPHTHILAEEVRKRHPSRNRKQVSKQLRGNEKVDKSHLLLKDRLAAARAESRQELSESYSIKEDLERSRYRQSLRAISERMESLRRDFDKGLDVLFSGRIHDQQFADWISSFQTMKTIEKEQQYQEQMLQRHFLEMQYGQQQMRRRESNERAEMKINDMNAQDNKGHIQQEQRRNQFLELQNEMKQIAAHNKSGRFAAHAPNEMHQPSDTLMPHKEPSAHKQRFLEIQAHEQEKERLHWLAVRKQEAKELERMSKEDLYYVERLQKVKALQQAHTKELVQVNPIDHQQRQIERRRMLDFEMKLMTKERQAMYTEDLFGRQYQLADTQRRKWDVQNEWRARKSMLAEEKDSRVRWQLFENERIDQEQKEFKRQRALERQQRRQQKQFEQQVSCAWIQSWDEYGNKYYYNQFTGCSQWENPFT